MVRKLLVLLSILASLLSLGAAMPAFAATSPHASSNSLQSAIASDTAPVDFSSWEKTCAVILVHLHGAKHTVTCQQPRSGAQGRMTPLISRDNACLPKNVDMVIRNTQAGQPALVCFGDQGYMGVAIYHVNEVDNVSNNRCETPCAGFSEWFRWYNGGPGSYYSLYAGDKATFGSGVTSVEVTQICIGSANWPNC